MSSMTPGILWLRSLTISTDRSSHLLSEQDSAPMDEYFERLSQGQVFPRLASEILGLFPKSTRRLVIVSQTCDVVLPKIPTIALAPVVVLEGELAAQAVGRDRPRYVPLGNGIDFADLAYIHACEKPLLVGAEVEEGIPQDDLAIRDFALSIGRWFSRFPIPDDLIPWFNPLLGIIREKYRKDNSPLGKVMREVVELRIEAENWSVRPVDVTLHVIVKAGELPLATSDDSEFNMVQPYVARKPTEIADLIVRESSSNRKSMLWNEFAAALAVTCHPRGIAAQDSYVLRAVEDGEISPQIWADDEFPLSRIRKSERLDLDYLSDGYPV
jgi:hypothetical protein